MLDFGIVMFVFMFVFVLSSYFLRIDLFEKLWQHRDLKPFSRIFDSCLAALVKQAWNDESIHYIDITFKILYYSHKT